MNAYTLELQWSGVGRSGVSFVYAEGEGLHECMNKVQRSLSREGIASVTLVDVFVHAECDKLQPCKNGVL